MYNTNVQGIDWQFEVVFDASCEDAHWSDVRLTVGSMRRPARVVLPSDYTAQYQERVKRECFDWWREYAV
jgi:hypothetical protein